MNLYSYTAILSKALIMQSGIPHTDRRSSSAAIGFDSECVTGHMPAENEMQAMVQAIEKLKREYPMERHYGDHENVSVQYVEEMHVAPAPTICTHGTLTLLDPGSMLPRRCEIGCSHCGKKVSLSYRETVNGDLCIVAPITESFGPVWEAVAAEWCQCKQHKSEVKA